MKTMCVGDIHGCGLELQELIAKAGLDKHTDQLVLIGDLFDRAKHGHIVWQVIHDWGTRCYCLQGNHERKMLKYLLNERDSLPPHYYWALDNLKRIGVLGANLTHFLSGLPTILVYERYGMGLWGPIRETRSDDSQWAQVSNRFVIFVHAGINIHHPLDPDPSFTVYGDVKTKGKEWWERYDGENLVIYGHLSELDQKPRIRMGVYCDECQGTGYTNFDNKCPYCGYREDSINSIGLDTACAHGGYLTGYIIETKEFVSVKAHKDWAGELKEEMKK